MGVYINMEMPTRCGDCPMGDALCCSLMPGVPALWKEYTLAIRTNRRHEDCPLVPVPKHGRLADLDKIENEIAQLSPEDYTTGGIRLILDSAPTIIPAEKEG